MKWQYKLYDVVKGQITEENLNNLGVNGWELVSYQMYNSGSNIHALFKRRIE